MPKVKLPKEHIAARIQVSAPHAKAPAVAGGPSSLSELLGLPCFRVHLGPGWPLVWLRCGKRLPHVLIRPGGHASIRSRLVRMGRSEVMFRNERYWQLRHWFDVPGMLFARLL